MLKTFLSLLDWSVGWRHGGQWSLKANPLLQKFICLLRTLCLHHKKIWKNTLTLCLLFGRWVGGSFKRQSVNWLYHHYNPPSSSSSSSWLSFWFWRTIWRHWRGTGGLNPKLISPQGISKKTSLPCCVAKSRVHKCQMNSCHSFCVACSVFPGCHIFLWKSNTA